ncbi:metal ABC transporter solute-binding protein, Zn/Mn family [Poriferisphaera sp. WC338]|uniref:metal ABC transporter solute-binding protein, Zn/Mn family n=1 Tax=Poriferisphaera sp. WC338 TaxID=3425129 RepID=UPI003D814694
MLGKGYRLVLPLIVAVLLLAVAAPSDAAPQKYPYRITTTVGMITDIVRVVGGEHVEVVGLMKEGVDPHLYKPTRGDLKHLMRADVVFYNGLMLEGKMGDVLVKVARSGKPVHPVTELLLEDDGYIMNTEQDHYDPHVWMDVSGWVVATQVVASKLSEFDPSHAEDYKTNAEDYVKQLRALDAYAKKSIASIPEKQRVLITAHDAFNYFGRAYGIEVRGIQGLSTESEAGVKDLNALVNYIVENNISAVFVESSVADKNVRALVEGAQAQDHDVRIGGTLFSDAMGQPGTYQGTYIGMLDHNTTLITRALGGDVPEGGFQGKLPQENHEEK